MEDNPTKMIEDKKLKTTLKTYGRRPKKKVKNDLKKTSSFFNSSQF
jgi:hypothetical protein